MKLSICHTTLMTAAIVSFFLKVDSAEARTFPDGSVLSDSLAFSGEVFVVTSEELVDYNINTVEDILEMLPGVTFWRKGPEGSSVSFSIDGEISRGMTLLVNGLPFSDPYNDDPLLRFIPLSRLLRVEVIYNGFVPRSGLSVPGGVINIVLEEGGREGPLATLDFTNGRHSRRSRRVWFATPESAVNLTFSYDQYLQDPSKSLAEYENSFIGSYNSRAILTELSVKSEDDKRLFFHFHRFDDSYRGTLLRPIDPGTLDSGENISYSGADYRLRFSVDDLSVMLRQRVVEMKRDCGWTSGEELGASAAWNSNIRGVELKTFLDARKVTFENRLWDEYFNPECSVLSCAAAGSGKVLSLKVRGSLTALYHDRTGSWIGGGAGICREGKNGIYQSINISRSLRMPAADELFQPELENSIEGFSVSSEGNTELDPEQVDELSAGLGFFNSLSIDLFAKRETRRIILDDGPLPVYRSTGRSDVTGARSRFNRRERLFGIDFMISAGAEYFGERSDFTFGIPEYRFTGNLTMKRRFFKRTETLTLTLGGSVVGPRNWDGRELERYNLMNASFSMTVMSAAVRFEMRNLFDTKYETVPGYLMPERHIRFGLTWDIFD
ncbi:MAG: TonB-dependent receptor [Candidatus Krumholzibacteriota bacterium]|nr:TonB-dependent receptor [Candidatus Krumholzibacteriota bacterium]